jgi:hypothetical protein
MDLDIFKKSILWILQGTSPENPKELWELIGAIDMHERVLVTYKELIATLKTLISEGIINESKTLHFYKTQDTSDRGHLSQISENEYEREVAKFREWLKQEWEKEEIFDVEIIRVKWLVDEKINKKMKKCFIEDLQYEVEEELMYYPREIVRNDKGKGHISFWILSTEDVDAHEVYDIILPKVKDFIQKRGGTCEIKVGNKGEEKKVYTIKDVS